MIKFLGSLVLGLGVVILSLPLGYGATGLPFGNQTVKIGETQIALTSHEAELNLRWAFLDQWLSFPENEELKNQFILELSDQPYLEYFDEGHQNLRKALMDLPSYSGDLRNFMTLELLGRPTLPAIFQKVEELFCRQNSEHSYCHFSDKVEKEVEWARGLVTRSSYEINHLRSDWVDRIKPEVDQLQFIIFMYYHIGYTHLYAERSLSRILSLNSILRESVNAVAISSGVDSQMLSEIDTFIDDLNQIEDVALAFARGRPDVPAVIPELLAPRKKVPPPVYLEASELQPYLEWQNPPYYTATDRPSVIIAIQQLKRSELMRRLRPELNNLGTITALMTAYSQSLDRLNLEVLLKLRKTLIEMDDSYWIDIGAIEESASAMTGPDPRLPGFGLTRQQLTEELWVYIGPRLTRVERLNQLRLNAVKDFNNPCSVIVDEEFLPRLCYFVSLPSVSNEALASRIKLDWLESGQRPVSRLALRDLQLYLSDLKGSRP